MALWTASGQSLVSTSGNTATSGIQTVTASATPHTMGAWTTLIASTSTPGDALALYAGSTAVNATDSSTLIDIGVGAAASERVLVAGVPVGWIPIGGRAFHLPVQVAAGERISARAQSAIASKAVLTGVNLSGAGGWVRSATAVIADSYGVSSAASSGTAMTDVGSANTKSAWTQIAASTNRRHKLLVPIPTCAAGVTAILQSDYLFDVGIGAPGSESVLLANVYTATTTSEDIRAGTLVPYRCDIPAGSALSVRMQKSNVSSQPLSMVLIGFD